MAAGIDVILSIGNNKEYVDNLIGQLRSGPGLTPFVGAGMSAQLQLLEWGEFLVATARRFYVEAEVRRLVGEGQYEHAAEVCIEASGPGGLQLAIEKEFGDEKLHLQKQVGGALRLVPEIGAGPVVTTNFDHVLERTFQQARKPFNNVLWGNPATAMLDAFQRNLRWLFKIHGDVNLPDERVLTRAEYNRQYGEPEDPNAKALPLHRVIQLALSNRPLLFLGCSLKSDRIIGYLREFYAEHQRLMHYAIVWRPADDEEFHQRGRDLTRLGLMPIWYPKGDYACVETILEHVLVKAKKIRAPKQKPPAMPAPPSAAAEALARQKYDELAAFEPARLPEDQYLSTARAIVRGELVLFFGWGAHYPRKPRADAPSSWRQVARQLAEKVGFDEPLGSVFDFARLTQYVYETRGEIQFEDYMRELLGREYSATLAHWFAAGLPGALREKGCMNAAPLILTANQDDVLERTFATAGEPLDTLAYIARGPDQGHFFYRPASGAPVMLRTAAQRAKIKVNERALLVKLHGTVDRRNPEAEKMVLTEDDYLSYLARTSMSELLPPAVRDRLIRSHFLFIGYALRDWTVRVLLKQIWNEQRPRKVSCAILLNADEVTRTLLTKQGVDVVDESWENVLSGLIRELRRLQPSNAS